MNLSIREVLKADTEIKNNKNFIFKPTEKECNNGLLHICYSSASDTYVRKSSDNEVSYSWLEWTYSCINMFRKVEYDWGMTYLARDDVRSPYGGELSWKFSVKDTDRRMDKLELRAPCALYEDGRVIWTICTDKQNFVQTDQSLADFVTFELQGARSLTITAFLTGGRGTCRYQHAQLFRQESRNDTYFPFEIKLFLESETPRSVQSVTEEGENKDTLAKCRDEINKGYIFTPNEKECKEKAMKMSYIPSKDEYTRHSSDTATLLSWVDYSYSSTNMFRDDNERVYLGLKEGADIGKVSWKFDVRDSGLRLRLMRMQAPIRSFFSGSVVWLICSGKQCYMETGDELNKYMTFELQGSTNLSITAFLSSRAGDDEDCQEARLSGDNSFSIELELEENPESVERAIELGNEEVDYLKEMSEMGHGFVFKPTEEEIEKKMMHICYSCTNDTYLRKSSSDEILSSWQNCTHSNTNLFRKENTYTWITYLVREDSDQRADITWKFDVKETGLKINKVEIRAESAVLETGSVLWIISSEKGIHTSKSLQETSIFNVPDASTLTITASLEGGLGSNAWEHSQLFPQPLDDAERFPFEVKVFFDLPGSGCAPSENIDASNWREPRGSFGIPAEICTRVDKSFVFKPTEKERANKTMHIRYNCASDSYSRELSPDDQNQHTWLDGTFSSTNMFRKEEYDHNMVYLARIEGTQFAEVTWKFDVTGTGLKMSELELKALTALYKDAAVLWTIRAGDKAFIKTAQYFVNSWSSQQFDLDGAETMTITAFLTGGSGLVAWQHSQIFRQEFDEDAFTFDVKLVLEPSSETVQTTESESLRLGKGNIGLPAEICSQVDRCFVFKPTIYEIESKLIHIGYNTTQDEYVRNASLDDTESSWQECIYSSTNLFLKEDYDDQVSYLARMEGTQFAEVTWKFDVTDTGLCMDALELKAFSKRHQDGCVIWTIQSDNKKFIQTGESLEDTMTFELSGSKTLSMTAFLTGGKGEIAWQQSQLFQQDMDEDSTSFPLEVKLFLKSDDLD